MSKGVGCALSRYDLRKFNAVERAKHMLDCKYHRKAQSSIKKKEAKNQVKTQPNK
jgi:hypothetical protein